MSEKVTSPVPWESTETSLMSPKTLNTYCIKPQESYVFYVGLDKLEAPLMGGCVLSRLGNDVNSEGGIFSRKPLLNK